MNRIDWDKLDLEIVAEAGDGQEAYELVKKFKPDILLVDVKMPLVNGIELIKMLKNEFPKIKYVILSGYDDFEYTKEAIKLGVANYIKKPIDEDELEQTLCSIKQQLKDEQEIDAIFKLKSGFEKNYDIVESHALSMLVEQGEFQSLSSGLDLNGKFFSLIILYLYPCAERLFSNYNIKNDLDNKINLYLNTWMKQALEFYSFINEYYNDEICILLNSDKLCLDDAKRLANFIQDNIVNCTPIDAAIGISTICSELIKIPDIYKNAIRTLKHKVLLGKALPLEESLIRKYSSGADARVFSDFVYDSLYLIQKAIDDKEVTKVITLLNNALNPDKAYMFSIELLESFLVEYSNILKKFAIQHNIYDQVLKLDMFYESRYILRFHSLTELRDELLVVTKELLSVLIGADEGSLRSSTKF
jgi:two-component system response regulator YesN